MNFSRTIDILRDDIFAVTFTLCMLTCYRNWMTRLPEFKTRINLLAETVIWLLGRCLEFQKQSKFVKTLSLKVDLRILKAELRSWPDIKHSDTYHRTREIEFFFYGENFGVLALWDLLIICKLLEKKKKKEKKKRTKTILVNLNEVFFIIYFHVQMFKWSAVNGSKFCMYFNSASFDQ